MKLRVNAVTHWLRAMPRQTARVAVLCIALLPMAAALADGPAPPALPPSVTLVELLRLVAARSPRLAVERVAIESAQADRISAGALPSPRLSYGRYRPSGGDSTLFTGNLQQQAGIDVPVPISGQLGARMAAADLSVAAARARVGAAENDLLLQAAQLFNGLQAAQEKIELLQQAQEELTRIVGVVSGRLQAGASSRYELTRFEIESANNSQRLYDALADAADKAAALAVLVDAPGWRPVAEGRVRGIRVPPTPDALRAALSAGNAQLAAARREEDAARGALRRSEAERWPVPVISLGRTWTSEPFGAANFVGLSAEIPMPDTRRGITAKAEAELRAAQRKREAVESEIDAEVSRLSEGLQKRSAALEQFERNVAARMPALKQMSEDAYRFGRAPILDLIDANRSRLDALLMAVDLRAAAAEQELRMLALTGRLAAGDL